ncbi:MAG: hypothetical protein OXQ31_08620 [Spirochaetaceae bacterium]|nr:hypothetical protein [Spirochaetaceae bacterium]
MKVVIVFGEHRGYPLAIRGMHQRCVREVHGTVGVTLHQFIESRKIVIDDGKNGDRIRPDQSPCWSQLSRVAEQVKQLGENRSGRPERETQALECRDTSFVPFVVLIEEGEQSAGVGKSLNAHVDPATPLARDCLPVPLDSDRPPGSIRRSGAPGCASGAGKPRRLHSRSCAQASR